MKNAFTILNYGAGAVGLGIDSCLLKSQNTLDIVSRPATVRALKEDGLIRSGIFGDEVSPPSSFGACATLDELPEKSYDFILVSTKSFDSLCAASDLANHPGLFNEKTKIVLSQNGWGNAEIFQDFFPPDRIYNARVITGFTRPEPNHVAITVHADSIHIGSLCGSSTGSVEALCEGISSGGIPCITTEHIGKDLWAKMLYNCALNSLGAILKVPYGVLGDRENTRKIMRQIFEEIYTVLPSAGYSTHWQTVDEYETIFYEKLLPSTSQHYSSTLQDIQAGKRTEIEALNGAVLALAKKHLIEAPINTAVYNLVKFIEQQNIKT